MKQILLPVTAVVWLMGQQVPKGPPAAEIKKLEQNVYAIGTLRIDTSRREVSMPGVVNNAEVLEFVACAKNGFKEYETALTIDTTAIMFNTAMLLIGLDPRHARVPIRHFDPVPPEGDAVELHVEWTTAGKVRRVPIEELLFDRRTNRTLPEGPWVYTGSTFVVDPYNGDRYLAEVDGVLIGFVHSPSPIIENPRGGAVNGYGAVIFNSKGGLSAGTPVTLIVHALDRQ